MSSSNHKAPTNPRKTGLMFLVKAAMVNASKIRLNRQKKFIFQAARLWPTLSARVTLTR